MSYDRVIPRDLFNEANLLKCYGKLYIELEKLGLEHILLHHNKEQLFNVCQDESGCLSINDIYIKDIELFRPLNSREEWPLYAMYKDIEYEVFTDEGTFTTNFKNLVLKHIE